MLGFYGYAFDHNPGLLKITIPSTVTNSSELVTGAINLNSFDIYADYGAFNSTFLSNLGASGLVTIHVQTSDTTWPATSNAPLLGYPNVTVVKDLPNP